MGRWVILILSFNLILIHFLLLRTENFQIANNYPLFISDCSPLAIDRLSNLIVDNFPVFVHNLFTYGLIRGNRKEAFAGDGAIGGADEAAEP